MYCFALHILTFMHPLKQEFGLNLKAKFLAHRLHNASRLEKPVI
jgi:hypothetical protein